MHLLQTVALKAGELLLLTKEEDLQCPAGQRLWLLMKENSSLRAHLASWRPGLFYRVFLWQMDGSRPAQAPPPPGGLDTKQLVCRGSEQLKEAANVDLCLSAVSVARLLVLSSPRVCAARLGGASVACRPVLSKDLPVDLEYNTLSLP